MSIVCIETSIKIEELNRGTKKRAKNPIDDPQLREKITQVVGNLVDQS